MPEDLALDDELDALQDAIRACHKLAEDRIREDLPGSAAHYERLAERLERLRARLEANPPK